MICRKSLQRLSYIESRAQSDIHNHKIRRTFFKVSYKKYRFHFGIYLPCSYLLNQETRTKCLLPSPIVLSDSRRTCHLHQKILFEMIRECTSSRIEYIPNKVDYQKHCLNKHEYKTKVFSHQNGTTYSTQINPYDKKGPRKKNKKLLYKEYSGFQLNSTIYTKKTQKKQCIRH